MDGKTVLVTGGNGGIGRETAAGLAALGAEVVITARDEARGQATVRALAARGHRVALMLLDLASFESIRRFAREFSAAHPALHVLVNNAGLVSSERRATADGLELTLGVNHVGPFYLTHLLLERLRGSAPARVVNVASRAHRRVARLPLDDLQFERRYDAMKAYGASKLANIAFTRELAGRLAGTGVDVHAVHPGLVATDFAGDGDTRGPVAWVFRFGRLFMRTPAQGAETSVWAASSPALTGSTGGYYSDCAPGRMYPSARRAQDDRSLWDATAALVRERDPEFCPYPPADPDRAGDRSTQEP